MNLDLLNGDTRNLQLLLWKRKHYKGEVVVKNTKFGIVLSALSFVIVVVSICDANKRGYQQGFSDGMGIATKWYHLRDAINNLSSTIKES